MNVLEEFWYGNLDSAEYDSCTTKEYKDILQLISRNEKIAGSHDRGTEGAILPIYRLCPGTSGDGRVFAISKQLPSGWQNDAGSDEGWCRG